MASQHRQWTSAKIALSLSFPDTAQCVCSIELARGGGSRTLSFFSAHEGDDAFLVLEGFSFFTYSRSPCCLNVKLLCSKAVDDQTNPAANPHHAFHANLRTVSGTVHAELPNSKPRSCRAHTSSVLAHDHITRQCPADSPLRILPQSQAGRPQFYFSLHHKIMNPNIL